MTCAKNAHKNMRPKLPPLNALKAFEVAGRLSSFSKAGEELNVSHSSISRHVRGLEARLGVQLFENLPKGVKLTTAGAVYLETISDALDRIAQATEQISPQQSPVIRLTCEPTFAMKWLMPRLGDFNERFPNVELRLDSSFQVADLHQRQFDLAIRFCSRPYPGLELDQICDAPVSPIGAPGLMHENVDVTDPATLLEFPMLTGNHPELWVEWFAKAGLPGAKYKETGGGFRTAIAIEAAAAGQGLALVSTELIDQDLKLGRLVRFSDVELDTGVYHLVYRKDVLRNKAIANFRNWLLETSRKPESMAL